MPHRRVAIRDIRMGEWITPDMYLVGSELELVKALLCYTRTKDIAHHLHLTLGSAKTKLNDVRRKAGVHDIAELVLWAVRHRIIDPGVRKLEVKSP